MGVSAGLVVGLGGVALVGIPLGIPDGSMLGTLDGNRVGDVVGIGSGKRVGDPDTTVGDDAAVAAVGAVDGLDDGFVSVEGCDAVGPVLGSSVNKDVGTEDGHDDTDGALDVA